MLFRSTFGVQVGLNVLNAGIILGLMAAPIMATIAEDALKAVPDSYREAAEALGATQWQVVWKVVLPHARPGLSAAVLLGIGRAFGETIAVLMASGHRLMVPESIFDSAATLTAFSRTVRHGSSANCWNTMATACWRISRNSSGAQDTTSIILLLWRTSTSPRVTLLRPLTARSSVDLPEPEIGRAHV